MFTDTHQLSMDNASQWKIKNQLEDAKIWCATLYQWLSTTTKVDELMIRKLLVLIEELILQLKGLQQLLSYPTLINPDTFHPIPQHLKAYPSVFNQLNHQWIIEHDKLSGDYYKVLSQEMPSNDISTTGCSPTRMETPTPNHTSSAKQYNVDITDMDRLNTLINKVSMENRNIKKTEYRTDTNTHGTHLLHIKLLKQNKTYMHQMKLGDQLKDFHCFAHTFDDTFKILPYQTSDQKLPNLHTTHFDPTKIDITRYHKPFAKNQTWSLTRQLHITTKFEMDEFIRKMEPWLEKMLYKIIPAESQTEELVTIGFLTQASYSLYTERIYKKQ